MNSSDEKICKLLGRFFPFPLPNYPCSHIFIQLTSILILLGYDLEIPV